MCIRDSYNILNNRARKLLVIVLVILAFIGSIMMLPSQIVLAKMLPGKNTNTFTIYVDMATNSTIEQTKEVSQCVVDILQKEKEITDMQLYFAQGAPLDYAGLVKGSGLKSGEHSSEIVVNLIDKNSRDENSFTMVTRLRPLVHQKCEVLYPNTSIKFIEMPAGPLL